MLPPYSSFLPLIAEISTYIFVIYGFAGLITALPIKKNTQPKSADILFSGLILYLTFYAVMRWLQLSPPYLLTILIIFILTGYVLLSLFFNKHRQMIKPLGLTIPIAMIIYILLYFIPNYMGGVDPQHYTMEMAWSMNFNWIKTHSSMLGWRAESLYLDLSNYVRTSVSAIGWLNNLSGISLNLGTIQRQIMSLLILTIIQFFRIGNHNLKNKNLIKAISIIPFLMIFIGANYIHSLTALGQLNTTLGIFLLVSIFLEIIGFNKSKWNWLSATRLCLFSFVLFTSYTELSLMLPLYIIVAFFYIVDIQFKTIVKTIIPICFGIIPIFILKFNIFFHYLIGQSKASVGAWPLGKEFSPNPLNIISNLVSSYSSNWYGLIIGVFLTTTFVLFNIHFLRSLFKKNSLLKISNGIKLLLLWIFIVYFITLILSSIGKTPNQSYIIFKISSWTSALLALSLLSFWNNIQAMKISKHIKTFSIIVISLIGLFSSLQSAKFVTGRFNMTPQQPPYFVEPLKTIKLDKPDKEGLLYDLRWVEHLAPWNDTTIIDARKL